MVSIRIPGGSKKIEQNFSYYSGYIAFYYIRFSWYLNYLEILMNKLDAMYLLLYYFIFLYQCIRIISQNPKLLFLYDTQVFFI